jgi:pyruvate dehydrogenase E2 component (dihydrolipoamide acetyltransferase)
MAVVIEMPKLSDTMEQGTLLRWVKKVGENVAIGDVIAEIQTDKAVMEMTANSEGIMHRQFVEEGAVVPLKQPILVLLEEDEAPLNDEALKALLQPKAASKTAQPTGPAAPTRNRAARGGRTSAQLAVNNDRVKASPLAKKVALEKNVDLRGLEGTGPGGRIVFADVENAAQRGSSGSAAKASPAIRPTMGPDDKKTPLSQMRTIIADRLLASKTQIPHFYLNLEVDMGPLLALRAQVNAANEKSGGPKYTVNDFILKAVAAACREVPAINSAYDIDGIVQFAHVNVSVAIAIEDGLVTPVIKDADKKTLQDMHLAVKDLADRAKKMRLTPDEFAGGTITVSNLGAYGIDNFDAIINPPQAAILSIGAAKKKPVVDASGNIVAGDRMWIGMSCDHRVVDGAVGATYLQALRKLIENPALALL